MRWNVIFGAIGAGLAAAGHAVGGNVGTVLATVGGAIVGLVSPQFPRRK